LKENFHHLKFIIQNLKFTDYHIMPIDAKIVMELRQQTGAAMMDAKKALEEANGDMEKAMEVLRKNGALKAAKKSSRTTGEGLIHAYVHTNGKVGAIVQVLCETDFVAINEQFKDFVHNIAMQIVATNPLYVNPEDVPAEVLAKEKEFASEEFAGSGKPQEMINKIVEGKLGKYYSEVCLTKQAFIKDEDITIEDYVKNTIAKIGENIQIKKFVRLSFE